MTYNCIRLVRKKSDSEVVGEKKHNTKPLDDAGPVRRSTLDRRQTPDRRDGVRWELDKNDRRRRPRRRKSDRDVWDHINNND